MTTMQPDPSPGWDECLSLLEELPSLPPDSRVAALERLVRNPSPGIRQQALRIGAAILPDSQLTEYLRADADAVLRNAGSEIFRLRGGRSLPVVVGLLQDPEPDVVLQAVLILDRLRDPRALEPLHAALGHPDVNVQQEAILAIGRLGDGRSIPHLLPFLSGDPWVQMAAVQALGDLRDPAAIPLLAARLTDPVVGSLAVEALARIGGAAAFRALVGYWPVGGLEVEEEILLGLLAHVLEGLSEVPEALPEAFRPALAERLASPSGETRHAAARCLLALGWSPWDGAALAVLARSSGPAGALPAALARRRDLLGSLLFWPGDPQAWGLLLAARFPADVPEAALLAAVQGVSSERSELLAPLVKALEQVRLPELGGPLLDLYLRLEGEERELIAPVLKLHAESLRAALARRPGVTDVDRLVLAALLGEPAGAVVEAVLALRPGDRPGAVGRLMKVEEVIRALPWNAWMEEDPDLMVALAAEAAGRYELRDLLPALRARAASSPSPELVRALGDLADRDSVPLLLRLLPGAGALRPVLLESLGRIGGSEARESLREIARSCTESGPEARMAFRALAACAEPQDEEILREAAHHPDWYVRLTVIDGLSRATGAESQAALARLAADPVPAVAHRALAAIAG
jgi:HEAT repeat protein